MTKQKILHCFYCKAGNTFTLNKESGQWESDDTGWIQADHGGEIYCSPECYANQEECRDLDNSLDDEQIKELIEANG